MKVTIIPDGSELITSFACSPENMPEIDPWIPLCLFSDNPSDAALGTASQYTILPVEGIMTNSPGGPAVAVDRKVPRGTGPPSFRHVSGNGTAKTPADNDCVVCE